jgi:hypothetical protein
MCPTHQLVLDVLSESLEVENVLKAEQISVMIAQM